MIGAPSPGDPPSRLLSTHCRYRWRPPGSSSSVRSNLSRGINMVRSRATAICVGAARPPLARSSPWTRGGCPPASSASPRTLAASPGLDRTRPKAPSGDGLRHVEPASPRPDGRVRLPSSPALSRGCGRRGGVLLPRLFDSRRSSPALFALGGAGVVRASSSKIPPGVARSSGGRSRLLSGRFRPFRWLPPSSNGRRGVRRARS